MNLLRKKIKEIIQEIYLNEFTDDEYATIKSQYSDKRIILSHENEIDFYPRDEHQRITYKPKGLWYGFGTSWLEWVRSEMPDWEKDYKSIFLLEINESSVLKLSSKEELIEFTKNYSPSHNSIGPSSTSYSERNLIDWSMVANKYAGIEINPYIYSARRDEFTNWYYPWDVASGCIWRKSGIKSINKIDL